MQPSSSINNHISATVSYVANASIWGIRQVSQSTPLVASVALVAISFVAIYFSRFCRIGAPVAHAAASTPAANVTSEKPPTPITMSKSELETATPKAMVEVQRLAKKVLGQPTDVDFILELARSAQSASFLNDALYQHYLKTNLPKHRGPFNAGIDCRCIVRFAAVTISALAGAQSEKTIKAVQLTYSFSEPWGDVSKGGKKKDGYPYLQTDAHNVEMFFSKMQVYRDNKRYFDAKDEAVVLAIKERFPQVSN